MELDLGNVMGPQGPRGSLIYYGTAVTGTSTSGTVFAGTGIETAMVDDKYLNTSTGDFYTCTVGGAPDTAQWAWLINLRGPQGNIGPAGPTGQVDENTPIAFSTPGEYSAPVSGNTIAVLFGKITKGLSDLFTGLAAKLDSSKVLESRNVTQTGYAMGAKTACEWMTELNNDMQMHYLHGTGCSVWYNAFIVILQLDITNATINAGINRFNMLALPKELKLKSANFARYVLNTLSSGWAPDGNQIYLSFDSESQSPYVQATGGKSLTNVQIQDIIIFPTNFFD